MANTFKTVTKSSVSTSSGSPTTIYTVPSATTSIVLGLMLANKHSASINVNGILSSSTTNGGASQNADVHLLTSVAVENGSSLEIMSGQKYVLQTGDAIKVHADNANIDVILSFMEIT